MRKVKSKYPVKRGFQVQGPASAKVLRQRGTWHAGEHIGKLGKQAVRERRLISELSGPLEERVPNPVSEAGGPVCFRTQIFPDFEKGD